MNSYKGNLPKSDEEFMAYIYIYCIDIPNVYIFQHMQATFSEWLFNSSYLSHRGEEYDGFDIKSKHRTL